MLICLAWPGQIQVVIPNNVALPISGKCFNIMGVDKMLQLAPNPFLDEKWEAWQHDEFSLFQP